MCFEKHIRACTGSLEPIGVAIAGPSLTEGYPAANPAIRLLDFDQESFELAEIETIVADIDAANEAGKMTWTTEYRHSELFNMSDLSPSSFSDLVRRMARPGSPEWVRYKGNGTGSLYLKGYTGASSAGKSCVDGTCKDAFITLLNGTFELL